MTSSRRDRCISCKVGRLTATHTSPPGTKLSAPLTVSVPWLSTVSSTKSAESASAAGASAADGSGVGVADHRAADVAAVHATQLATQPAAIDQLTVDMSFALLRIATTRMM